jgi:hypothetical protein
VTAFGDYEQSYPPEVLRGYEPPVLAEAAARRSTAAAGTVERTLTVAPGEPGSYEPELAAADRPRNVTELRERARVVDPAPWAEGEYVLIGTSGKRAHWDGDDWHSGESPGYRPTDLDGGEVSATPVADAEQRLTGRQPGDAAADNGDDEDDEDDDE